MTDEEITLLRALRMDIAALQTTTNMLVEQTKVLYEDVTNLHDRMARIEEKLRVKPPNSGRGYAYGRAPAAECAVEGCGARAVSKGLCARHYMRMRADERREREPS
jgi:hypothetical protein